MKTNDINCSKAIHEFYITNLENHLKLDEIIDNLLTLLKCH